MPANAAHQLTTTSVSTDRWSQSLGACGDHVGILGSPEHQIDRVEGRVAQAGRRVDRHEPSLLAAVEDIHRGQVAVKENCRWRNLGEPHRQPASPLI